MPFDFKFRDAEEVKEVFKKHHIERGARQFRDHWTCPVIDGSAKDVDWDALPRCENCGEKVVRLDKALRIENYHILDTKGREVELGGQRFTICDDVNAEEADDLFICRDCQNGGREYVGAPYIECGIDND